ncbi:heavy metal-associated isoprenylated plant protein 2-like [Solanum lycopersicum]|uniref:heavy metal-associated isoprenylated plant protein 2-like n=1 Tax=Solanum lycopersicum TaxID=4081 RepID=UPI000276B05E|nr:heavy metal-associated isoprenylated plant protein 2-like [Solanum lycopersicum]
MKIKVVIDVSVNGCQPRPSLKNCILGWLKPMVPCLFKQLTCKNKVMTIAATLPGVEKVSLEEEKNLLTVIGEGIDAVELVNIIRKKVGFAKIVNQGPEPVEKKEEKTQEKKDEKVVNSCNCHSCYYNNNNNRIIPRVEMWEVDPYTSYSCW